jgi:cytochrome c biogenesis protein CcmG/thiol:disulfide interchange protein DsbE
MKLTQDRDTPPGGTALPAMPARRGLGRAWRWLIPLSAVPVLALLAYGFRLDPRNVPSPLVGKPAAPFALTTFEGQPVSLEALRGRVVVVNFWASWCYPACYEEAPALERSWRAYRDRGVTFVGVDIQDKPEAAAKFIRDFQLSFPNAPDPTGRVSVDYGVYGVPETFFIDRQGRIRAKHVGAVTEQVIGEKLDRLLAEAS